MKKIRVGTVFSGIGAFEWALKRLNIEHQLVFACDNGDIDLLDVDEEMILMEMKKKTTVKEMKEYEDLLYSKIRKTNYVFESYKANYDILEENLHRNIRLLDGEKYKDKVDILVGGSPCQSFSMMGYQKGLEDTRGTLFYEYARIVKEVKPKVFIYENVQGLLRHDKGNTWEIIHSVFESLGYHYQYKVLNSKDFGIPQNRNRLFVVGFLEEIYSEQFNMPSGIELNAVLQEYLIEYCKLGSFKYDKKVYDPGAVEEKYYLSDKVLKHVMSEGTKNYRTKPQIDLKIARPLLATMHKMHRAGVDNYVTVDGRVRRLTPRECLRLMGFGDDFVQVVSDTQMYKQTGNSIVVDIFIHLIQEICKTGVF